MTPALEEALNPPDQQDEFTVFLREEMGYRAARRLDDGTYVALLPLMYTLSICLDVDRVGYGRRYCYDDGASCIQSYLAITRRDDTPEGWIAKRPKD